MSYEGRVQALCKNGHKVVYDAYAHEYAEPKCPFCQAGIAWENNVDDTNCDAVGYIPNEAFDTLLVKPAVTKTCPTCHHTEELEPPVFRVPSKEERAKLRHFWDGVKQQFIPMEK